MKTLRFYFDPVSPYAALAFERLPEALVGISYEVEYRPVLFAGILHVVGQKGPAEIESKRQWTFRHVAWLADQLKIALDTPARHPFNPLPLLRMAWATVEPGKATGTPNRLTVEKIFRYVWQSAGADANDPARLAALRQDLALKQDPESETIKEQLRTATEQAIALGVFGVPTIEVDGRLFWGLDSLPMLAAYLNGEPWFDSGAWEAAAVARPGVLRKH